ncbi:MAG: hypothetical protein IKJ42_03565 [Bacteroidaceae bacterium]|nr:hypothetical protein [Bacteroidaceae bacterium]
MKKHFYLAAAALLSMAATVNAQDIVISEDMEVTDPASWGTHFEGARDVTIAGATVTFANEGMNTVAFHPFYVDTVRLYNGAKIVMFDSPDTWYPNPDEDPSLDVFGAAEFDDGNGSMLTEVGYRFKIMGDATIVCDSKCTLGGKVMSEDGVESTLTLVVGDSTKINIDFMGFTGTLKLQYREEAKNQTVLFGGTFPGTCPNCKQYAWSNSSSKCWCAMPWSMEVVDGTLLKVHDNAHTAFPEIRGRHSIYAPRTLTLRPLTDFTYDFDTYSGGGDVHLELFAGANTTLTGIIDFTCKDFYVRNKYVGVWINSDPSVVTLANQSGSISVRNNDGFVGGIGNIGGGIACKDGITTHIIPGEGYNLIGDLTVQGNVSLGNNNAIDVDFGGNGASDRLMMPNPEGACYISGTNTRLWINMLDEFYANPKAGNYKIVNAANFVPNTVYTTDTTGTRFRDLAADIQDAIVDSVLTDSVLTFPNSTKTFDELKDSLKNAWGYMFEQFQDPTKKHRDTLFYNITKIDTLDAQVNQNVVWMTNTREDGTACDSLPEGYSWYPVEWDEMYAATPDTIAVLRDSLVNKQFFERGVITIYSKDFTEVDARKNEFVNMDASAIEEVMVENKNHGKVVSSQIYTEDGKAVGGYVKGVNILRTVYSDGTVTTTKVYSEGD